MCRTCDYTGIFFLYDILKSSTNLEKHSCSQPPTRDPRFHSKQETIDSFGLFRNETIFNKTPTQALTPPAEEKIDKIDSYYATAQAVVNIKVAIILYYF